ncbi:MAG: hypothetical protein AB7L13_24980 [Acidimicrobiia bacterium]
MTARSGRMSLAEARRLATPTAWAQVHLGAKGPASAPARRTAPKPIADLTHAEIEQHNREFFRQRGWIPAVAVREAAKHGSDRYVEDVAAMLGHHRK